MFEISQIFLLNNLPFELKTDIIKGFKKKKKIKKGELIYSKEKFANCWIKLALTNMQVLTETC